MNIMCIYIYTYACTRVYTHISVRMCTYMCIWIIWIYNDIYMRRTQTKTHICVFHCSGVFRYRRAFAERERSARLALYSEARAGASRRVRPVPKIPVLEVGFRFQHALLLLRDRSETSGRERS